MSTEKGWFGRNWKWVVPVGCLLAIAIPVVVVLMLVGVIFGSIGSSDVAQTAVEKAKSEPQIRELLGEPIERGWFVSGSLSTSGPSGEAELSIPLSGPEGAGTLYVEAQKSAGEWTYSTLVFEPAQGGERLDLIQSPEAQSVAPPQEEVDQGRDIESASEGPPPGGGD